MRLHVLSDLHIERAAYESEPMADADVVVLAGDIWNGTAGVQWAREWVGHRPALYLAGNHEFYGESLPSLLDGMRRTAAGSPVHVLENDELVLDGVRFLGCTLWSDFDFDGPDNRERSMAICAQVVNDYSLITFGPDDRVLTPRDTRMLHVESRRWLASRLAVAFDGPTVVITHHQPVIRGRPDRAVLRAVAGAFVSDLSDLMGASRVALWIYGHTHRAADLDVRGTRVISNPRGYPNEPVDGFDPGWVIDVPGT